jgi:hypothetical protein
MARGSKAFTLDDAVFKNKIRKLAKQHGLDETKFVKEQGALLARDFARMSPPYASFPKKSRAQGPGYVGTKKDQLAGIGAIKKDSFHNFVVKDRSYLDYVFDIMQTTRFIKRTIKRGDGTPYFLDIDYLNMGSVQEAIDFHRSQMRASDGRPSGSTKGGNDFEIGRWKPRNKMWIDHATFNKMLKIITKDVGELKASWIKAAIQLNPKTKAPAWVLKQMAGATGSGTMVSKKGSPTARIYASAYGMRYVDRTDIIRRVKLGRMEAMEKRLQYVFKQNAKKAGFKVR